MLDFGFSEILLTSAIALVVLGPERLPKVARQVGNWMGRARAMARQLSEQLEREVDAEALLKEHSKPSMARLPPLEPDAPPRYVPPAVAPQYAATTSADAALIAPNPSLPPSPPDPPAPASSPAAQTVQSLYEAPSNGSGHADYEPPPAGASDPAHRTP